MRLGLAAVNVSGKQVQTGMGSPTLEWFGKNCTKPFLAIPGFVLVWAEVWALAIALLITPDPRLAPSPPATNANRSRRVQAPLMVDVWVSLAMVLISRGLISVV